MMTYPVSVIIPAHNAAATLERAVMSAINGGAREVVIVNDGSTDDTNKVAQLLERLNATRINIVETQYISGETYKAGVCHARNLGINHAQYDFIVPLDADDALLPDGIRLLYQSRERRGVIYGGHLKEDSGEFVHAPPPERLPQKNLTGATYGFWKQDWRKAGGYHPDFNLGCEDYAFMAALVSAGVQLVRVDEPVYVYSPGGKRAARCMKYADAIRQLLAEHYPAVFSAQQSR